MCSAVMTESAGSSFKQILPYLYKPEVDSDQLETLSGEDDSALQTEHLEEPNQGRIYATQTCVHVHDWCSEQEQQTLDCITQNSAFYRVVLEHEVLHTALLANMDRLRESLEEPLPNSYDELYEQGKAAHLLTAFGYLQCTALGYLTQFKNLHYESNAKKSANAPGSPHVCCSITR